MKQRNNGFTLVEILVVLMIIGMLCVLLFGSLGPAREKGRQSSCASNLHQWGTAFAMYILDYDGIEPQIGTPISHSAMGLPPGSDLWVFMKQYKTEGTAVMHCPSEHYISTVHPATSYFVNGILGDEDTFPGYDNEVAKVGPDLALVVCGMHNVNIDFIHEPSWATKWLQTVHIDQHVTFRQMKASAWSLSD